MTTAKQKSIRLDPFAGLKSDWKYTIKRNVHGEYVVRIFHKGKHLKALDYFTPDKDDAGATADLMIAQAMRTHKNPRRKISMRELKREEHEHYTKPRVSIDIDVDSHNAKEHSKTRVNPIKGKKSIRLQKRTEGVWVTIAAFEHTRENVQFAKQLGNKYHRKHPEYALRII